MSDISKLAREVLEKAEKATPRPWKFYDAWGTRRVMFARLAYDIVDTVIQANRSGVDCEISLDDAEYIPFVANAAPQLATAYLEMQAELQARERDFVAQQQMLLDLANALKRAEDAEAEFKQWHDRAIELQTAVIGRDQYIKEQQAENERLREEIKKLLHLAELDYQRAFDGLSSGQYIIALDSVLGIAESAKTVAQRALTSEQP